MSTDGAFDFRNHTAWARDARKAQDAGPAHETRTGLEDEQALEPKPTVASHTPAVGPRDVWSPRITAPDRATVWKVGETVTVRWDASHPPKRVTNSGGKLVLGHFDDGEETNEHLNYEHPLADGFDLSRGQVQLKVPNVKPSNNYIVVLFGDSGNHSPQFTIVD
ncbi:hypothetical protein C8Q74DRAFT_1191875 [Fomes fomentarius]|nr:hypothetical protein C8Q74DRAFT_1191875 [Fomes fomentarius]